MRQVEYQRCSSPKPRSCTAKPGGSTETYSHFFPNRNPQPSRSILFSTISARRTESSTLQMIRGERSIFSSRAVRTAAITDAAMSSAFFWRGSSATQEA